MTHLYDYERINLFIIIIIIIIINITISVNTYLGVDAYDLWKTELELRNSIQRSLWKHVLPRHQKTKEQSLAYAEGEKSLFLSTFTSQDIEDIIVEAIADPTYLPLHIRREIFSTYYYDYGIIKT